MKKTIVVLLMGAMLFTACGQSTGASTQQSDTQAEETQEAEAPAEEEAAEAPAEEEAAEAPAEEEAAEETAEAPAAEAATGAAAEAAEETAGEVEKLEESVTEKPGYVSVIEGKEIQDLQASNSLEVQPESVLPQEAVKLEGEDVTEDVMEAATEAATDGVATIDTQDLGALGGSSVTITASSTLYESGQDHRPSKLLDGNVATAWVEGASGYGSGEYVRIGVPKGAVFHGFGIVNGYQKSEDLFYKNSRPQTIIVGSGNTFYRLFLTAGYGYYEEFDISGVVSDGDFYVIIDDVIPGSRYKDTCISEIWTW